jgi:hypothetical protein
MSVQKPSITYIEDINAYYQDNRSQTIAFFNTVTNNDAITNTIISKCVKYNVAITTAMAIAMVESNFTPRATNRNTNGTVDRGLFQLNSFRNWKESRYFDIEANSEEAISHMSNLKFRYNNDEMNMALAYNSGVGSVQFENVPASTYKYNYLVFRTKQAIENEFNLYINELTPLNINREKILENLLETLR